MNRQALIEGIWERDATTWTGSDEAHWLGWLDEPLHVHEGLDDVRRFAEALHDEVDDVVLCGMGGSSLAPEVLRRTFAVDWFHVLDTTHPRAIRALEQAPGVHAHQHRRHDPERGERRVAAADRRLAEEDAAEAALAREMLELGPGVGDGAELLHPLAGLLPEVLEVRARLERRARLR